MHNAGTDQSSEPATMCARVGANLVDIIHYFGTYVLVVNKTYQLNYLPPVSRFDRANAGWFEIYFLWISTVSMTSPCSIARTTAMPLVTLPKTAWQEMPYASHGFDWPST